MRSRLWMTDSGDSMTEQDEVEALLKRGAYGTLRDEEEANEAAKYCDFLHSR